MAYPSSLDSFTPRVDDPGGDNVVAADVNVLQTAIEAIETELGTDPAGSATDLKTRLAHSLSDAGYLEVDESTVLTIASGEITVTQNYHRVDTESSAATDNLDTINGGAAGMILILRAAVSGRDVVIRHGVGNINCAGDVNISLMGTHEIAVLIYDGVLSAWIAYEGQSGDSLTGNSTSSYIAIYTSSKTLSGSSAFYLDQSGSPWVLRLTGQIVAKVEDGGTDTVYDTLQVAHESGFTPAAGFGVGIALRAEDTDESGAVDLARITADWKTATHASRVGRMIFYIDNSTGSIEMLRMAPDVGVVFNEGGLAALDLRVEGDTDANLLFVDASADKVGIGMNNPSYKLDVTGVIRASTYMYQAGTFAEIHCHDASAAQNIATGTTYVKLTCFTDNGQSSNCTADAANDKITIVKAGKYRIHGTIGFTSDTNNVVWRMAPFVNGVEQDNVHAIAKIGTGADVANLSFDGFVSITSTYDIDMRARHDAVGTVAITPAYANLNVQYLGE